MARGHAHESEGGQLLFGLALLAVLVYRPDWISAAVMAYAHFWETVVSPVVLRLILGG